MRVVFLIGIALAAATAMAPAAPRPLWTSNRVVGSPNPPAPFRVERIFPTLGFTNPVDIAPLPASDRMLVLEQGGKLYSFVPTNNPVLELVFDFRKHHQPFDSSYSIAFHPRFAENRFVFVCYAEPGGRTNGTFISRFTMLAENPPRLDPASEKVIIRWLSGGHNGCTVAFGNDGFLYFSTGDAANPDPPDSPYRTGQDLSDLLSSIIRIDVDRAQGTNAYSIPADNPFVNLAGARPEVYAFGLRNPWRMSFDPPTGDLWVGDVGWEQWEMVYRVKSGANFGWPITEGPNTHVRTDVTPGPGNITPPLVALPHSDAASITGGRVYHGKKLSKLAGAYIYGDWETGKFWALRHNGDTLVSNEELCDTTLKPASFSEDHNGELIILDYNGGLHQFVPQNAPPANLAFPRKLTETGLFADVPALAPAPGIVPYQINSGMWNDYAEAERWLGVPGDGAIATGGGLQTIAGRMWYFPSNTVFARTLTLEMQRGERASRRRIETQLLHFEGQAWNAYTYRWNQAQTDAELVPAEGANDTFTITDPGAPGGRREIPWRFVGRAECLRCHNAWAGETLSFNWSQLNTPGNLSELDRLEGLGLLRVRNRPAKMTRLAEVNDPTASIAEKARSWLHVNCATCHRMGAGGDVPSHFNYEQKLEETRALDAKPVRGDFGIVRARVIAPADPYRSTLFYRVSTEGSGRMPHIGSRVADERGIRVLRDWIASLAPSEKKNPDTAESDSLATALANAVKQNRPRELLSTMNGALALLDAVSSKSLGGDAQLAIDLAAAHTNALVRDLFQRLLPTEQRRRTLGTDFDPKTVLTLKGNADRGRELFFGVSQCSRCHVALNPGGTPFGPDLTGVAAKYNGNRAQVLEHIVYPSRIIAPEYKSTVVILKDETEFSGFVRRRTATDLVLNEESQQERSVPLAEVKTVRESTLSAMPEGLLAPLTAQEAADLLEFLVANPSVKP